MSLCPTCGAELDDTDNNSAAGVTISAQDFKFLFDAFETLMSPYSSNDQLAEIIKTEDDIWAWLKQIKNGHPSASLVPNTTD